MDLTLKYHDFLSHAKRYPVPHEDSWGGLEINKPESLLMVTNLGIKTDVELDEVRPKHIPKQNW